MTEPILASAIRRGDRAIRRFIATALEHPVPDVDGLAAAGVPRYDALPWLQRLRDAGELGTDGWMPAIRDAYRSLLAPPVTPPKETVRNEDLGDRPRERALEYGIDVLSDAELLALLLRTGSGDEDVVSLAKRLLREHDGLLGLAGADLPVLMAGQGIGPAKAAEVAAAFELGRRLAVAARGERPVLRDPAAVAEFCGPLMSALQHEEFWCLPLDARSRLIGRPRRITRGDVDGTDAGPRAFFRGALVAGAVSAIAVHNHPTGDPSPSAADRAVTRRLRDAGELIDIALVDHVIIGDGGRWTSLRRELAHLFG